MRRLPTGLILLALLATLLTVASPAEAQRARTYVDTAGLHVTSSRALTKRLREITMTTAALDKPTTARIMLPPGYNPNRRYPVVYLLNGAYDDYTFWTKKALLEKKVTKAQAIFVMPDGGYCGFYTDWYNYGLRGNPRWETYHIKQLIPFIDRNYKTLGARGRAVAGLSMGGFGAMSYAGRHPKMFRAAASFSGGEDMDTATSIVFSMQQQISGYSLPGGPFGLPIIDENIRRAHNPPDLAPNMRGVKLDIYSGNGAYGEYDNPYEGYGFDILEATSYEGTKHFVAALDKAHVPHTFHLYNGTHKLQYWNRNLRSWLINTLPVLSR